jgi:hypothetical protein
MAGNLIGRFYFKKTSNGNLIGEFSNNLSGNIISTESADFIKKVEGADGDYFGEYNSTWQENGNPLFANLKISPKAGNDKLFTLNWSRNGKRVFVGEGMLCDDILIGDYQD